VSETRKLSASQKVSTSWANWLRGSIYWLLTAGPAGTICGWMLRRNVFDRLGPVYVPQESKSDTIGAIIFGMYEYPERVLIKRWLPSGLDCVELGSSIGIISRVILQKLDPTRRVFAVEASEELLDLAEKNVAAAGATSRFSPIHGAIHYDGDTVVFDHHAEHIRGKVAGSGQTDGVTTPCVTLAQVIRKSGLGPYSLVMDIEGSEFDLIDRDLKSLVECQAIIAELHGDEPAQNGFVSKLKQAGFLLAETKHSVFVFIRSSNDTRRHKK